MPALRPCLRCGRLNRGRSYCRGHEPAHPSPSALRPASRSLRQRAIERAGHRCEDCGREPTPSNPLEVDAVVPVADGGAHVDGNVRVRCRRCHQRKTRLDALARAR